MSDFKSTNKVIEVFEYRKKKVEQLKNLTHHFTRVKEQYDSFVNYSAHVDNSTRKIILFELKRLTNTMMRLENEVLLLNHLLLNKYIDLDSFTTSSEFYYAYLEVCEIYNVWFIENALREFYKQYVYIGKKDIDVNIALLNRINSV